MRKLNPELPAAEVTSRGQPKPAEIRNFAESLLARREYAVRELQSRLLKKWSGLDQIEELVDAVIDVLQTEGLLSDERFTESFIRSRLQRCQGPVKIQAELRQRHVPEAIVQDMLQQVEDQWVDLAKAWLSRQVRGPMDFPARAKYYRRLMNRGFSHQQAADALASLPER